MNKENVKQYLIDEAEYCIDEVDAMSDFDLLDNYLAWNGIVGYTEDILNVVGAIYGVEL